MNDAIPHDAKGKLIDPDKLYCDTCDLPCEGEKSANRLPYQVRSECCLSTVTIGSQIIAEEQKE